MYPWHLAEVKHFYHEPSWQGWVLTLRRYDPDQRRE